MTTPFSYFQVPDDLVDTIERDGVSTVDTTRDIELYLKIYNHGEERIRIAVRVIKVPRHRKGYLKTIAEHFKTFDRQCRAQSHQNICPMVVLFSSSGEPAVVMPSLHHGNILDFTRNNKEADKLDLLRQAASGLTYLHGLGQVHGDLSPLSIAIIDKKTACVCDAGFHTTVTAALHNGYISLTSSWPYKSPEELCAQVEGDQADDFTLTPATDIYCFSGIILAVFTGKPPFDPNRRVAKTLLQIRQHGHSGLLSKPKDMDDSTWGLVRNGWKVDPTQRPLMSIFHHKLMELAG